MITKPQTRLKGTFNNEKSLSFVERVSYSNKVTILMNDKNIAIPEIAFKTGLHVVSVRRIKNNTKPYTLTAVTKIITFLNNCNS